MITARILADSINPAGSRLTSFLLTYNRFIHSEFLTHRVFSRNAASSRARPLKKVIEGIECDPALPERWGSEQKGMQSGDELREPDLMMVKDEWCYARIAVIRYARVAHTHGLHKSLCNRLLEPFDHITVVATAEAKGLSNFFALRANPAAQPEFQVLAYRMLDAYLRVMPEHIEWGNWHIPRFGHPEGPDYGVAGENGIKIATARCARLSYLTHEGKHDPAADIELHDRLAASGHWSCFEHCAQATRDDYPVSNFDTLDVDSRHTCEPGLSIVKGLSHWKQYRKNFETENISRADLPSIFATKPDWITL